MTTILLFFHIFSFPINFLPSFFNSARVIFIIMIVNFLFDTDMRKSVLRIFSIKKVILILGGLLFLVVYSAIVAVSMGTYDFSIIPTFLNQLLFLVSSILVCAYIFKRKKNISIEIVKCFIAQSVIQIISMVNGSVKEFFDIFRSQNTLDLAFQYGNIRGVALSGTAFYGLGVAYAICYILYVSNWDRLPFSNNFLKTIFFILLIIGGQSAARISTIGLVFCLLLLLKKSNATIKTKLSLKTIGINSIIAISIAYLVKIFSTAENQYGNVIDRINKFVFQLFYAYKETGHFSTNSTSRLFNQMYFVVPNKTLFLGDGQYTSYDGSYYMRTDAGYMRNTLFFGMFGTAILIIYQLLYFDWKNKNKKFENLTILLIIFICHIKGEVVSYLIITQVMLLMTMIESYHERMIC